MKDISFAHLKEKGYVIHSLETEATRTIHMAEGFVYTIQDPMWLVIRPGGSTHRVVDLKGVVHCYPAPETGKSIIVWEGVDPEKPVLF